MKKLITILTLLFLTTGITAELHAQWLENLGRRAAERAKDKVQQKVEDKVDKTVDKTVDGAFDKAEDAVSPGKDTSKDDANVTNESAAKEVPTQQPSIQTDSQAKTVATEPKSVEMAYAKSDFVPGDEVIFDDTQVGEKLGEFPSQWDLISGNAEIASIDGQNVISIIDNGHIAPLMKDMKNYLPESFTIEFDIFFPVVDKVDGWSRFQLFAGDEGGDAFGNNEVINVEWFRERGEGLQLEYRWVTSAGEERSGNSAWAPIERNAWHRIAISFNKRALKIYLDGMRLVNIPNCIQPTRFMYLAANGKVPEYIRNIRIAKGAVPLYDRMMSEGKFITYGITFDVGKSTIKPESMGELNRVVQLMNENPSLSFSVEGHTDATGGAALNQTLSESRSKAVVDKLVEMGIASNRLTSAGKGQTNPIADNATDEGRAKNRRVEFVKK